MHNKSIILKLISLPALLLFSSIASSDHASIGLQSGQAGPIGTTSAVPLPKGSFSAGLRTEFVDFNRATDEQLAAERAADPEGDIHSVDNIIQTSVNAGYGITEDLTVGLSLPYVIRNRIREAEGGDHHGDDDDDDAGGGLPGDVVEALGNSTGLGDITVFGQYRFFHQPETKSHAALLLGVKAPTGFTGTRTLDGELLEAEFQPGSGSWDGLIGLAGTQVFGQFAISASGLYAIVSEGTQKTDWGDIFSYNLAVAYRLGESGFHANYIEGERNIVDLILELNGEWRDKEFQNGVVDNNSGSNIIYISPGFRFAVFEKFNMAFSFGFPILKDLGGFQVDPNYRAVGSISFNF